ncbi:hypothetical protein RB628_18940 [Streptomyces sp. ADMS]|uniref:hypothetical protein n=1 Tax=Streptomyces sp. ADMS TaxID=3071415 RepID=UPI00296FD7AC|nr:hypothetical protein [Streptomyces sp. ADMS]MDW4907373.1 hypothetical protein [Streptomyces sp. ADMS]
MDTIVEIHVPLEEASGVPEASYAFPWIDRIEDFLADLEVGEEYDEGEQCEGAYVFFVTGAAEADLLAVASRVAALPSVPGGVFAVVTEEGAGEIGVGRRVEL